MAMNGDGDYAMALRLQEEYDRENAHEPLESAAGDAARSKFRRWTTSDQHPKIWMFVDASLHGVVENTLELSDPTPDIHTLFIKFDKIYFQSKLEKVEVRWSPRMTLCAGLCCYEGFGGLCSIRLSKPLLTLRPRKDTVQTLLHEMIHAFLFVTHNNKDHDAHGAEFLMNMHRINKASGANISVYHNFHDEVDAYRTHWWQCDGPCRQRSPYHGLVKRAMNRPPSHRDIWWARHQSTCGGMFTKIREPEAKIKNVAKKKKTAGGVGVGNSGESEKQKGASGVCQLTNKVATFDNFVPFSGSGHRLTSFKTRPIDSFVGVKSSDDEIEIPVDRQFVTCPVCLANVYGHLMNDHLDNCLN